MSKQTIKWIESCLVNDETSTDAELIEYFVSNSVDRAFAEHAVSQRAEAICTIDFKLHG